MDHNNQIVNIYEVAAELAQSNLLPGSFSVGAAYPNPFNAVVAIPIKIPVAGQVDIDIYNILGQKVRHDTFHFTEAKEFKYHWNSNTATGIYFAQIQFRNQIISRKLMLLK